MARPRPILIVDDNQHTCEALALVLRARGYATVCANDGAEALEYLRRTEGDASLILLDLYMPIMDGRAFRATQQADAALASIPVIAYTVDPDGLPDVPSVRKGFEIDILLDLIPDTLAGRAH